MKERDYAHLTVVYEMLAALSRLKAAGYDDLEIVSFVERFLWQGTVDDEEEEEVAEALEN